MTLAYSRDIVVKGEGNRDIVLDWALQDIFL